MIKQILEKLKLDSKGNEINLSDEHFISDCKKVFRKLGFEFSQEEPWGELIFVYQGDNFDSLYLYSEVFKSRFINLTYVSDERRNKMVKALKPIMKYYDGKINKDKDTYRIKFKGNR